MNLIAIDFTQRTLHKGPASVVNSHVDYDGEMVRERRRNNVGACNLNGSWAGARGTVDIVDCRASPMRKRGAASSKVALLGLVRKARVLR